MARGQCKGMWPGVEAARAVVCKKWEQTGMVVPTQVCYFFFSSLFCFILITKPTMF